MNAASCSIVNELRMGRQWGLSKLAPVANRGTIVWGNFKLPNKTSDSSEIVDKVRVKPSIRRFKIITNAPFVREDHHNPRGKPLLPCGIRHVFHKVRWSGATD